jgi:hypothetical protein
MTEEEKPLTREEVLKMIEEHGGPEGLDLSGRNLTGIDLSEIHLSGANLQEAHLSRANLEGAELVGTNLQGAWLSLARLERANIASANLQGASINETNLENANLAGANLQNAKLRMANLRGSRLLQANLQGAVLWNADFTGATLDDIKWSPKYIVGDEEELEEEAHKHMKCYLLGYVASVYRTLKRCHNEQGLYNLAGEFYFREMTVKRKALQWWPNPLPRAWSKFIAVLCGYGERPLRVVASAAVVVFGLAGIYSASALTFPSSLYHSVVSFTALGYGLGVSNVDGWVKAVGAAEAFIGVFMMALFLITFVRKMTR